MTTDLEDFARDVISPLAFLPHLPVPFPGEGSAPRTELRTSVALTSQRENDKGGMNEDGVSAGESVTA